MIFVNGAIIPTCVNVMIISLNDVTLANLFTHVNDAAFLSTKMPSFIQVKYEHHVALTLTDVGRAN